MSQGAQALLRKVIDDPESKSRLRDEARATLTLLEYLGVDDCEDAILFLLRIAAGLQEQVDKLEKRRSP